MPGGEGEPNSSPSAEPAVWTVSEINKAVRALLEEALPPLWVSGEVANWKRAASGHCYFTLKDESAQLRCVMWRGEAAKLPMDPDEGMRIRVFGQLTVYEARGEYQLSARMLDAEEGEGLWKLAFERLKKKLDEEGLLRPESKRRLPRFPEAVGVVTSLTGAALHDILTVLRRRAPWLRVVVRGARVQGEGAAVEIAEALRTLAASGLVEVVIVGRGGGSLEDLWAFNEEPVARAVSECPVPVVSAVGHEVDVTISDLVADLRAATPSAAAEAVAPDVEEILRYLEGAGARLAQGLRRSVTAPRRTLSEIRGRLVRVAKDLVPPRRRVVVDARTALARAARDKVQSRRFALVRLGEKMNALSPLSTLKRGYAVPLAPTGRVLRSTEDFSRGEEFRLRVVDGRVHAETTRIEKDEVDHE
ncbi:MAG: exodeoxyribonuclease VII large subunit [Gemmatimonadota bacterium]